MSNKKQSSVEWLIEQIEFDANERCFSQPEWFAIFQQAKAMHRKEIIESYLQGALYMNLHKNDYSIFPGETSEQYYTKIFEGQE